MDDKSQNSEIEQMITSALKYKAEKNNKNNNQKEWNEIMEETNKEVKKQTSRTRMFAIAASILFVAVIGGTVLAVTANGDSKAIKTVDDKDKTPVTKPSQETSSTTTIPSINGSRTILKQVQLSDGGYSYDVYSENGNKVGSLPVGIASEGSGKTQVSINSTKGGKITGFYGNGYTDPDDGYVFDIATGQTELIGSFIRAYSPSGNKYAEKEISTGGALLVSTFIVDVKTGQRREIKPVNDLYITVVVWIDDTQFMYQLNNYNDFSKSTNEWFLADLTKLVSYTNDKSVITSEIEKYLSTSSIIDAKVFDGKRYFLLEKYDENYINSTYSVMSLDENGRIVFKDKDIRFTDGPNSKRVYLLRFDNELSKLAGSFINGETETAFSYDLSTDTGTKLDGALLIPNK